MPPSHRYDEANRLRVICKPLVFEGMVAAAFNMIRQNSEAVAAVSIHLLETITIVAGKTHRKEDHAALVRHADMVAHGCREKLSEDDDREDLQKQYAAAVKALDLEPIPIDLNPESHSLQQKSPDLERPSEI